MISQAVSLCEVVHTPIQSPAKVGWLTDFILCHLALHQFSSPSTVPFTPVIVLTTAKKLTYSAHPKKRPGVVPQLPLCSFSFSWKMSCEKLNVLSLTATGKLFRFVSNTKQIVGFKCKILFETWNLLFITTRFRTIWHGLAFYFLIVFSWSRKNRVDFNMYKNIIFE